MDKDKKETTDVEAEEIEFDEDETTTEDDENESDDVNDSDDDDDSDDDTDEVEELKKRLKKAEKLIIKNKKEGKKSKKPVNTTGNMTQRDFLLFNGKTEEQIEQLEIIAKMEKTNLIQAQNSASKIDI